MPSTRNQNAIDAENARRNRAEVEQLTADDLKSMTPAEIVNAQNAGALDNLSANGDPARQTGYRTNSVPSKGVQGRDFESIVKAGK